MYQILILPFCILLYNYTFKFLFFDEVIFSKILFQDYQTLEATKERNVGEKRLCQSFDIRLSTLAEATIDILFSKEKVSS